MLAVAVVTVADLAAQAVPENSQASRIDPGYLRPPHLRIDPFRHVMIPHWGVVFSGGASGENNWINFNDGGALKFLSDRDSLALGDALDVLGLIPNGEGLGASAEGEGGVYFGGPFGRHLSIGFSGMGRVYGGGEIDESAVALFRDGNGARQSFSLGNSRGEALVTADAGVHAVVRLGPIGSVDGVHLILGFGGRFIKPLGYLRGRSTIQNGGTIKVTGDSVSARIELESLHTPDVDLDRGSGAAGDFLLRLEWPTSGLALEAMVANVGKVTVNGVERRTLSLDLNTTKLDEVNDVLDTLDLRIQDTIDVDVTLPTIVRFSGSAWANRILQLDMSTTLAYTGSFEIPLTVDIGSTWRFVRTLPIRLGLVFGGHQKLGYTGGIGLETRNFLWRVSGGSLGGWFDEAKGAAGLFEFGFFF
ncbi:MAG: hypothetical protein ACE5HT_12875 [Gemmatimonadales bacterium]